MFAFYLSFHTDRLNLEEIVNKLILIVKDFRV